MADAPDDALPPALSALIAVARSRSPLGVDHPAETWARPAFARGASMYRNRNDRLGINFEVDRLSFPHLQTMDPRVVRIAPGATNERHRHAHESLFVVLAGRGEVEVGDQRLPVGVGDVAFVPRWIFHQTRNTDPAAELVVLAITDFGFTSAVLGDYDQRTRLAQGGGDAR